MAREEWDSKEVDMLIKAAYEDGQEAERAINEKLLLAAQKAWVHLFRTAAKDDEAHAIRAELMQVFGELEVLRELDEVRHG